jgi:preprotein translocase subunit SecA
MLGSIARKLFGSKNERDLKKLDPLVQAVNELEPSFKSLTDRRLGRRAEEFRNVSQMGNRGRPLA